MSSSIKSKDAHRKLRRWGFSALIAKGEGQMEPKALPGTFFGYHKDALNLIERLKAVYMKDHSDVTAMQIDPIPYETVSTRTRELFESINNQAELVTKAAFLLAEKYRLSVGALDRDANAFVVEAMEEAMKNLSSSPSQVPVPVSPAPEPVEDKSERRHGVEELSRVLSEPLEDAA